MSVFPSTEAIMLEIHQSFGGQGYQTKKKNKFATGQANLAAHTVMGQEILESIFSALDMDPRAQKDALDNFMEFGNSYKTLELNTWTFAAEQQQVLWALLAHFFAPVLGRRVGFWNLGQPLDKGMPGGRFWYLPELREIDGESCLHLPVAQVIDWLLDLLGLPLEEFADQRSDITDGAHDSLRRSLYNWRNKTLIQIDTIQKYFSDDQTQAFAGAFVLDSNRTPAEQFADALNFVKRKKLTAHKLRFEIPITQEGRLETILDGRADEDDQAALVSCLAERYAVPSMHVIRQRLLLARAVQDGYVRLLGFLCPSVDKECADLKKNKLLQLFSIYKLVYNLTVGAYHSCQEQGENAENIWFEQHLPESNTSDLFLSILPSRKESASLELAFLLTRRFYEMRAGDELEDYIGFDAQSALPIIKRNSERSIAFAEDIFRESHLLERIKKTSPWRVLQGEHSYWVVSQLAQNQELNSRAKDAIIQRLRELASTPAETVQAIALELDSYLNCESQKRTKDTQAKVQALLDEAEASDGYEMWKAVVLQYKAKHLLGGNDFKGAKKLFRAALEAARERCYGPLRGEVARDCLALAVANQKLTRNNHEKYYREMLAGGMMADCEQVPTIEETARWASEYFWDTLYKPYAGIVRLKPLSRLATEEMLEKLMPLLSSNDQEGLQAWIKSNHKLLNSSLPDVDGNSVLMLLIKMRTGFLKQLPQLQQMVRFEMKGDSSLIGVVLVQFRQFLTLLINECPKQLNIPDFKGQTPLMLITEEGDTELVKVMLQAGADPEIQDWEGMTALHSAVKSGVSSCVDALLDHPCRLDKLTHDGQSPLHTASWTANMHAVKRLVEMAPDLAWQRNSQKMTPLERVEDMIENPQALKFLSDTLSAQGNRCASKSELMSVVKLLEQVEFVEG